MTFENGIVSLNFGIADEVLRARASRTTHPVALHFLSQLCSLILGRTFEIDNPYLYYNKAEVTQIIANAGAAHLIPYSRSCAHTIYSSSSQYHCGTCSQCIDRRIAILAANLGRYDAAHDYVSDVFTGPRKDGYEKNMAIGYIRHSLEMHQRGEAGLAMTFALELSRAVRYLPRRREAAEKLIQMHLRHATNVRQVLLDQLHNHDDEFLDGTLDNSCMLALVHGKQHLQSTWQRYADRIIGMLVRGLPIACHTEKPANELRLQEICDALLRASDDDLVREYPLMQWALTKTKPDWSAEHLLLWIELKYVRSRADLHPISEAIAADITKYGDNRRHVLFIIYDPYFHIASADEAQFAQPISGRPHLMMHFIR